MRLWHKDLISVLPKNQLIGQWSECCAIAKNIAEKGTPNHIMVNRIMNYPMDHFWTYGLMVGEEMQRRGYNVNFEKFVQYFPVVDYQRVAVADLFCVWHSDRYLKQCYYNIQEKFDCGGIPGEDWIRIINKFEEKLNK